VKLETVDRLAVFYEPSAGRRRKIGRLVRKQRQILFEYEPAFLGSRLELSPFHLPLRPGVIAGPPQLDGLMGVFDDSLPDGWGRLLIDRRAAELGISGASLTPLDRLTLVGARSMGALVYEPEVVLDDASGVYVDLLKVTRQLTRNEAAVAEMFRRACFNVFAHNRDDHCRNFSFLMDEQGRWAPSPAYDLTFAPGPGGEHTLLVAGEARAPGAAHLATLATRAEIKRSARILDEVRAATSRFKRFADQAGVPARLAKRVADTLARVPR
jgi:hypothetical protein